MKKAIVALLGALVLALTIQVGIAFASNPQEAGEDPTPSAPAQDQDPSVQ